MSFPIWPGIFLFLKTREGVAEATDGTWRPMKAGTVRCTTTLEAPSFDNALETFTDTGTGYINNNHQAGNDQQ